MDSKHSHIVFINERSVGSVIQFTDICIRVELSESYYPEPLAKRHGCQFHKFVKTEDCETSRTDY